MFHHQQPLPRVSQEKFMSRFARGVSILWFLALAVAGFSGCANVNQQGQSQEVRLNTQSPEVNVFFVAGKEANYLSLQCPTSGSVDLGAYTHLMEVKYPRTLHVDVLRKAPSRPYKSFAVLECSPGAQSRSAEVLEGLKSKAREIGADAIILCQGGSAQGLPELPPSSKMQAVAIRYILTSPSDKENKS
jgi:hypothetical protein